MIINNNIPAMNTYNQMSRTNTLIEKSMERLSSGFRINKAADDAAGLAISEKMRAQIRGLNQAQANTQDAISLIQTAEGGFKSGQEVLKRINELAVKASSETLEDDDLASIGAEINELLEELDATADNMKFNGKKLLDGSADLNITVGANGEALNIKIGSMKTADLGDATNKLDTFKSGGTNEVVDRTTALALIDASQEALKTLSTERAGLGAKENRMEYTIENIKTASKNLTAAESRIRDVDVAKEMMEMTKNQILAQASTSMLAQAMQSPQQVLMLLR
ncbi:flagellin (plasmid) [Jeotgalibacillus malaysiensis]|uniref:Flagellin n=1 Tax=Jeotgalibacillus malaysiensis TaxID=1508404 RepID=A0A0B5AUN2_9BACL|nr:flagellin [Jeotgalibacillus malaysiensis]AJD93756.1 flagellin [Jeotgalibacillus malaysiensis]